MRMMWPWSVALLLGVTAAAPAQFTVNGARIKNGSNSNAAATAVPTVGLSQMIPRMNGTQMIGNPLGGGQRALNFKSMIPNFSWMRSKLWPIATPNYQLSPSYFNQQQMRSK